MSTPLDPLTDCSSEEENCVLPAEVQAGISLLVTDLVTKCVRQLAGEGVAMSDGNEVRNKTGAVGSEIKLPSLKGLTGSSFPRIIAQNDAGTIFHVPASEGCAPYAIVSQDGSFKLAPLEQNSCWSEICEKAPEELAGWVTKKDCDENERKCLVRFPVTDLDLSFLDLYFESSSCVEWTGDGSIENPYKPVVQISGDSNNCIECRDDGLYVQCGVYGGSDPIDVL